MNNRVTFFLLWAVGVLLAASGCVEPVAINPPVEREICVKGILVVGDTTQKVTLLYSGGFGDSVFDPITNAQVTVNDGKLKHYSFNHVGEGVYESGIFIPKAGESYSLEVVIPGRKNVEATTTVPAPFAISSLVIPPAEWYEDEGYYYFNYWNLVHWPLAYEQMKKAGGSSLLAEMPGIIFKLDSLEHHHLYVLGRMEDATGIIRPIKELATNHQLTDHSNANGRTYRAGVEAGQSRSDLQKKYENEIKRHYAGLALHDSYLRIDYPMNYDNGLRNIYRIINYSIIDVIKIEEDIMLDANRYFAVVGDFDYNIWCSNDPEKEHPVLYFCSVSDEYDKYLQSLRATHLNSEGDVLSSLYGHPDGGYTNVRNGCGVFGAISTLRHDCDLRFFSDPIFLPKGGYYPYSAYPARLPEL